MIIDNYYLLNTYYMPGIVLTTLYKLIYLILITALWDMCSCYPYLTNE